MDLFTELERLERTAVAYGVPASSFAAPADDAAIDRLTAAVAPMEVPSDVITLYRWHNGCELQWLDDYGLQSIDEMLAERAFQIDEIGDAPAWSILSRHPRGSGARVVATLGVPGAPKVEGLWSVETHDGTAARMYDSTAAAAAATSDLIAAARPGLDFTRRWTFRRGDLPDLDYRVVRNPNAFRWPDPPRGSQVSRFPDESWPSAWTASLRYRRGWTSE